MFICLCHAVTDETITTAIAEGHDSLTALMRELKVATQCGGCLSQVMEIVDIHQSSPTVAASVAENISQGVQIYLPQ